MRVSELAKTLDISVDTVRYYTRIGLLAPTKRDNGYRDFSEADCRKLRFVLRGRQLGFALSDIKTLIAMSERGDVPCPVARDIISRNLDSLKQSIDESQRLYQRMAQAVSTWQLMPDCQPNGKTICSLIEDWEKEASHDI